MRTVSVRLERLDQRLTLRIWGLRKKDEEEKVVVAAVKRAGGYIDPGCVRGKHGEIIVLFDSDPGSLQKRIVDEVRAVLPGISVRRKAKK